MLRRLERIFASDVLVGIFASSSPMITSIALASVGLAVAGAIIHPSALTFALGVPGAAVSMALATYSIAFALAQESGKSIPAGEREDRDTFDAVSAPRHGPRR